MYFTFDFLNLVGRYRYLFKFSIFAIIILVGSPILNELNDFNSVLISVFYSSVILGKILATLNLKNLFSVFIHSFFFYVYYVKYS